MNEYEMIREEIVLLEKESLQIKFYVLTTSIAIAGLATKETDFIEIIPILYQVALIWGLDRHITSTRLRIKLSTYVRVFIESKNKDFKWETRYSKFVESSPLYKPLWRIFKMLTSIYTLLFLIGLYVSFKFIKSVDLSIKINIILLVVIFILNIFTLLFLFIGVVKYPQMNSYTDKWKKIAYLEE